MSFDEKKMVFVVTAMNVGDDDETIEVPAIYVVCQKCDGKGSHVNEAVDGHGLTAEDFDEDPDFRENYFSGLYDVTCSKCNGKRVVPEPDESKCTKLMLDSYDEWALSQAESRWTREDFERERF